MNDLLGQQLGNYRLMRILGQGGFADVYLGEHIYLRTQAALKVLQMRVSGEDMDGFLNEARTVASLKHPHIVRVLDFGVERNIPYLVMEYAPLGTLRQHYPKGTRLPLIAIVSYVKQVASALQYAHERRLVHRDVKPENILLESDSTLLLSDFGIALVAQSSRYQNTQETAGTIAYMAPEQLQGKPRPASDQYALGIVVYEWISGDRPFHGSFSEMYSQHLFVPPPPLSEKIPTVLHDIDAVIQTALAKDPLQRFPSVQTFAEALEQAAQKALPTFIVPPRGLSQPGQPSPESGLPQGSLDATVEATPHGRPLDYLTRREAHAPRRPLSRRAILLGAVGLAVGGGTVAWLTLARNSSSGATSHGSSHASPPDTHTPSAGRTATVSQPIGYLFFTYQGHGAAVGAVAWAPNGQRLASGSSDRTAQVWDASSGTTLVTFRGHAGAVQSVAWSPDGKRMVSGGDDHTVQIWDAASGNAISQLIGHADTVWQVAWSPDGNYIASASNDKTVRIWDARAAEIIYIYPGHADIVYTVAWSPDSAHIASGSNDQTAQVWDALSGTQVYTYRKHTSLVTSVAWSPDGTHIASGSRDKTVQIWDAASGNTTVTYRNHVHQVNTALWSSDGLRIASSSNDDTVHLWDAASGNTMFIYRRHADYVWSAAWSPDGQRVASACNDGTVQVWQAV